MSIVQQPPILPQGWKVEHSPQYNCPFYVNIHTNESVWVFPTAPALPAQTAQSVPTQQNHTSKSPHPKDAALYAAGSTIVANGQHTPVYSPVDQTKSAYFSTSQNSQQPYQTSYVYAPVPNTPLPVVSPNSALSVVNHAEQQLPLQAPGAYSQPSPGQNPATVVPTSSGPPMINQRGLAGQPQTQGTVLQQLSNPIQQTPTHQALVQTVQVPTGSAASYYAYSGPPQTQTPQSTSVGHPQPQQQPGITQPNQQGGDSSAPSAIDVPVGERGLMGDLMGSFMGSKPAQGSNKPGGLLSSAMSFGSSRLFGGKKQAAPQQGPSTQQYPAYQQGPSANQFATQGNRPTQSQQFTQGPPRPNQQYVQGPPRPSQQYPQGPPRPGQQYPQGPPQQYGQVPPQPQASTPVTAAKPAKTGQAALIGGIAGLGLGGLGAMALGKNSNSIGGLFGGHSSSQSGGHFEAQNNQSQLYGESSQQTNGGNSYFDSSGHSQQQNYNNDLTQQSYADPSGNGGAQAQTFDPTAQVSYTSDPTQASYTDPTTAQNFYTDPNYGTKQSYTDPTYSTQAYADPSYVNQAYSDPSYDTSGQSYVAVDQSYDSNQAYDDPAVDAAYAQDVQDMNDTWEINNMNTIAAGSEQIAEIQEQGAEDMLDLAG